MVTMEDIVEELVGDIQDEFDHMPKAVQSLSGGAWIVGGGAPMHEVVKETGVHLLPSQDTLAAWLASRLGRAPVAGDIHREAGFEFTVRRIRRGKAYDIGVTRGKG